MPLNRSILLISIALVVIAAWTTMPTEAEQHLAMILASTKGRE